jgi:transcriptional regulator with XRE-family HTH domain
VRLTSIADIAAAIRGRRLELRLSQGELAFRASVSRRWLTGFEAGGSVHAELGTVLRVLDALDLDLRATPRGTAPIGQGTDSGSIVVSAASAEQKLIPGSVDLDALLDRLRDG